MSERVLTAAALEWLDREGHTHNRFCDTCWRKAGERAFRYGRSRSEHYREITREVNERALALASTAESGR